MHATSSGCGRRDASEREVACEATPRDDLDRVVNAVLPPSSLHW
jgi:hypothetical protein